jgi:hypothetical protein
MINKQTGQQVNVIKTAGSLFFIPVRYWAFIVPIAAVILSFVQKSH